MPRRWTAVLVALLLAPLVRSQQEDTVLNKTLGEWLKILRTEKDVKWRRASLIALEVYGPKKAGVVPGLLDALEKDAEPTIRRETASTLGRMGPDAKGAIDALAVALKNDKSEVVREAAARALGGRMATQSHSQVLILGAALGDAHAGTRTAAAETLRDLGEHARAVVPQLCEALADAKNDRFTRTYVAQVLGRLKEDADKSAGVLATVVIDAAAPVAVREAAADALGRLGADSAIGNLAMALSHKAKDKKDKTPETNPPEVRRAAALALAKFDDKAKGVWSVINAALRDPDSGVRYQVIRLAGRLGREVEEVVPNLVQIAAEDEVTENRLAAVQELGELGPVASRAVDGLSRLARDDTRSSVREAAQAALKKIQGK